MYCTLKKNLFLHVTTFWQVVDTCVILAYFYAQYVVLKNALHMVDIQPRFNASLNITPKIVFSWTWRCIEVLLCMKSAPFRKHALVSTCEVTGTKTRTAPSLCSFRNILSFCARSLQAQPTRLFAAWLHRNASDFHNRGRYAVPQRQTRDVRPRAVRTERGQNENG